MSTHGKPKSGAAIDALELLKTDHEKVKSLFREFESLCDNDEDDDERKFELVDDICYELTVHSMIEEEIFYPVLRSLIDDDQLLDEAEVEHAGARDLISQLEVMYPGDDHFDAMVTVLGEEMAHHIDKEESELFDAARRSAIDLDDLGERLSARKDELDDDLSSPPSPVDAMEPHNGARRTPRPPN
ncbi:hemerythrin domain-containing protein [Massilia pseudoviolaceinigra]|uniref:hemerythrin domain-containing protein n=1 Tax=Massilia pseudoviolaceinigra TaxID=3057165 RepID=UPI002796ADC0|nr:hemerythrin domain-containing protein [Massilia sp. CCM 9206]MDQ1920976.1 hemerythrin domain-containing protein [Massilia sp. CCM 9206]